jgi:hypothetical protein
VHAGPGLWRADSSPCRATPGSPPDRQFRSSAAPRTCASCAGSRRSPRAGVRRPRDEQPTDARDDLHGVSDRPPWRFRPTCPWGRANLIGLTIAPKSAVAEQMNASSNVDLFGDAFADGTSEDSLEQSAVTLEFAAKFSTARRQQHHREVRIDRRPRDGRDQRQSPDRFDECALRLHVRLELHDRLEHSDHRTGHPGSSRR